jgi:hypothetical protein
MEAIDAVWQCVVERRTRARWRLSQRFVCLFFSCVIDSIVVRERSLMCDMLLGRLVMTEIDQSSSMSLQSLGNTMVSMLSNANDTTTMIVDRPRLYLVIIDQYTFGVGPGM